MTETLPELSLVIFDMDGTLVDSGSLILEVFARTFATVGHPVPEPHEVLTLLGLSLPVLMARLMPEADAATLARAVAVHKAGFVALRQERGAAAAPLLAASSAALRVSSAERSAFVAASPIAVDICSAAEATDLVVADICSADDAIVCIVVVSSSVAAAT